MVTLRGCIVASDYVYGGVTLSEYQDLYTLEEIRWARDRYLESFEQTNFEDYIRREKIKRVQSVPKPLFGFGESLFSDFSMHPNDMEFELVFVESKDQLTQFFDLLEITSSQLIERGIPGRSVKILVKEKNTNTVFGFIRIGSPVINMKPRNILLNTKDYTANPGLTLFNDRSYLGQIIVPAQPAGFNYIAGKLLALMCVSHEVREYFNQKYGIEIVLFETTSLYGSIKAASQYDGLKPYIRKGGQTESTFMPALQKDVYIPLRDWFEERLGEPLLAPDIPSSRKMKIQRRMESIILNVLKDNGQNQEAKEWTASLKAIEKSMTTQKNYYYSTFGFSNAVDYIMSRAGACARGDNYDKFYMENLVEWWRHKATNRYEKLKADNRLRTKLEVWTDPEIQKSVDIVR